MGDLRISAVPGGILLDVHLRPRASRAGVGGVRDGALELRVCAPPVEGEANAAARELLADLLGVSRSRVVLHGGEKSRRKVFRVDGLDPAEALRRLAAAGADLGGG
ncbi:MAG TPA: DUF167 domain-containing protein [bacterium]